MTVRLVPAAADHQRWIRDDLQSYLAELSEFGPIGKNPEGTYDYPYLDHYWREPDRHPFVIHLDNAPVGFLLVREDMNPADGSSIMEIAELYILPAFRQHSVATSAITEVVSYFPGNWRAAVLPKNHVAYSFWQQLISALDPAFTVTAPASSRNPPFVFTFRA